MPIIHMYRDGEVAEVNTDHVPTHENFLAHGWTEAPIAEAPESPVDAPEADEAATPDPDAPEASPEAPVKPLKATRKRA